MCGVKASQEALSDRLRVDPGQTLESWILGGKVGRVPQTGPRTAVALWIGQVCTVLGLVCG